MVNISILKDVTSNHENFRFAYFEINGITVSEELQYLDKREIYIKNHVLENFKSLSYRASKISKFYKRLGSKRRSHIETLLGALKGGQNIKRINNVVDIVLFAELEFALLMGVHDLDKIEGNVLIKLSNGTEKINHISKKILICQKGDILLKDDSKVFASLTQGPDDYTKVEGKTKNILVICFFLKDRENDVKMAFNGIIEAFNSNSTDLDFGNIHFL